MIVSNNANNLIHYVKSVHIRTSSGPHFPTFGHSLSLRIQSECREIRTRITPNMDTYLRNDSLRFRANAPISFSAFQYSAVFAAPVWNFSLLDLLFFILRKNPPDNPLNRIWHDIRNAKWWRYQCNKESENRFKLTLANLQKSQILAWKYCLLSNMQSIFPARCHLFTKSAVSIASVIRFSSFTFWSVPRDETTKEVNNLPQLRAVGTIKLITT